MAFELDPAQLDALAPFSIVCSGALVIERTGPSLHKALGMDIAGTDLFEAFTIERPQGITTTADIRARAGAAFLLRSREHDVSLRCQPICPPGTDRIVFFGALALASESDMSRLGLGYADFAASDPTPDLLILKRTQERSLQDLATLNADLERSGSQLRAANAALTEAERRYRALVEQQPLVTYIDDLGESITSQFTSENVLEVSGYPAERWTGEPDFFLSILHPDDVVRIRSAHLESVREQGPFRAEFRLLKPDGSIVWVQAEDKPVLDDDGVPLYRLGYLLDITERRTAEDELRETGTRLKILIESLQAGILVEDEHRRVALTNQAFCTIFGIPAEPAQLVGADCEAAAEQSKHLAAEPDRFVGRIDEILSRREAVYAEEVEFADGRVFERDYVPVVVEGEHRGHLWGYRDVTPRIEAQRAIELAHDEAVAASRAKSEFLATVSHEIRTPMHGVLGTIDLLERTQLDGGQAELVSIVKSSAGALLSVINDMLDLQKAETGHMELACAPVDVPLLVRSVLDVVRAPADAKGIELVASVEDGIPDDLLGDQGRIRQILVNLLGNAVKFTEAGSVSLTVRAEDLDDRTATLALIVADTGMGIPLEAQEQIFEPFAQVDSSSTRHHEGTGLGLAITRRLVELMNGGIALESAPGQGTTVTAVVGLLRGPGATTQPQAAALEPQVLDGTVLLVEDSPVNRELALRQLGRLGVAARAVESGTAALEALEHARYDLVLMDVRMPGMSGLEATRAIRAREATEGGGRTTIVAMTANAMPEDRAACMEAGMDDFATKPLLLDDLAAVLSRWLSSAGKAADAPAEGGARSARDGDPAGSVAATLDRLVDELGSADAVRRVTERWLLEMPGRLAEIRAAAEADDGARIRDAAHLLKSACALVGAQRAATLAAAIERRAADGAPVPPEEIEPFEEEAERAAHLVLAWHATAAPAAAES